MTNTALAFVGRAFRPAAGLRPGVPQEKAAQANHFAALPRLSLYR
jgi:hypothetical protein